MLLYLQAQLLMAWQAAIPRMNDASRSQLSIIAT